MKKEEILQIFWVICLSLSILFDTLICINVIKLNLKFDKLIEISKMKGNENGNI